MHTSVFLTLALAGGCCAALVSSATPAPLEGIEDQDGSGLVYLSPEQVVACKAHGGCRIFTRDDLMEMVKQASELGARQAAELVAPQQCIDNTRVKL